MATSIATTIDIATTTIATIIATAIGSINIAIASAK